MMGHNRRAHTSKLLAQKFAVGAVSVRIADAISQSVQSSASWNFSRES